MPPKVILTNGGPHLVEGCDVFDPGGALLQSASDRPIALCACGKSGNMPRCDGSHSKPRVVVVGEELTTPNPTAP